MNFEFDEMSFSTIFVEIHPDHRDKISSFIKKYYICWFRSTDVFLLEKKLFFTIFRPIQNSSFKIQN